MGEARRRKLAGTYPLGKRVKEFDTFPVESPSMMPAAVRREFEALVDEYLADPDVFGDLVDTLAENHTHAEAVDAARALIVAVAEEGCFRMPVRPGFDHSAMIRKPRYPHNRLTPAV